MIDPSQQCPDPWVEDNLTGASRTCSRPENGMGNCLSVSYPTNGVYYNNVCGRSIGYQQGTPDAFFIQPLDGSYVDGLSITYGSPRQHIWSFAAGLTEDRCFCGDPSISFGSPPPSFVENNYFCASGNAVAEFVGFDVIFSDDPLWDGMNCPFNDCCEFNTPPWFNVQLPAATTDSIEVRLCLDEPTSNENVYVQLLVFTNVITEIWTLLLYSCSWYDIIVFNLCIAVGVTVLSFLCLRVTALACFSSMST